MSAEPSRHTVERVVTDDLAVRNSPALQRALALACEQEAITRAARAEIEAAMGRPKTPGGLIRAKTAAFDWGVSVDTVIRWVVEGKAAGFKTIGGYYVQAERPVDAEFAERTARKRRA